MRKSKVSKLLLSAIVVSAVVSGTLPLALGQVVTATIPVGASPTWGIALNPVTNKLYVANQGASTVTVIDGATNTTATVGAGPTPYYVAVNPATNKVYVTNIGGGSVTVIDGSTNATTTVAVGTNPYGLAVNPVTNKIYVANDGSNSVTVIDGATNSTTNVPVGTTPLKLAVNPVTNKVYVGNYGGNSVTIIDGATNATSSVSVPSPFPMAVNPVTNKVYVGSYGSASVYVIDGATNAVSSPIAAGANPWSIELNPSTNKVYVASVAGSVTVIDGATNAATSIAMTPSVYSVVVNAATNQIYATSTGGTVAVIDGATNAVATSVTVGTAPEGCVVNPVTNKIYVANSGSNNVSVIDGATNAVTSVSTGTSPFAMVANPATNKIYVANEGNNTVTVIDEMTNGTTTINVGSCPYAMALNRLTNKIYVANNCSNSVTVIDGATNGIATVAAGACPQAVAVNPVTNRIYVANQCSSNVTVIAGEDNSTTTVSVGSSPFDVAVNMTTNKIYVANQGSSNVTVIDGLTNSTTTVSAGTYPYNVAVNPVTNQIYVTNNGSNNVTVIDGATNATANVAVGACPWGVAVNAATNKIYVANECSGTATLIDGATNTTSPITVATTPLQVVVNQATNKIYVTNYSSNTVSIIDGLTNTTAAVSAGTNPYRMALNPVSGKVYVGNYFAGTSVAVISPQKSQTVSPSSAIKALPSDKTVERAPTFAFDTSGTTSPPPQDLYYQMDSWQGPWQAATGSNPSFTGTASGLALGPHILYAFATDGSEATSLAVGENVIGSISAYPFTVVQANTTASLVSDSNPSLSGNAIHFTTTVSVASPGTGTPTGTVSLFDGSNLITSGPLDGSAHSTLSVSSLGPGPHSITAVYSGDANFIGSTSSALPQLVQVPLTVTATVDSKTYNATTASAAIPTITSGSLIAGHTAYFSQTFDNANAGTNRVLIPTGVIRDGSNADVSSYYALTFVNANGTITAAPLTITSNSFHKAYGTTYVSTGTEFTVTGTLYSTDSVSNVALASVGFPATATFVSPGPTYAIVPSNPVGSGLSNYGITYVNGTLTIDKATLTVTAKNQSKVYGSTFLFAGTEITTSALKNADAVTSATLTSTGAGATATVASPGPTYAIVPTAALGSGLGNYTIAYVNGTLTVTKAPLTVTPDSGKSKVYGTVFTGFTGTISGLQGTDSVRVTYGSAGAVATAAVGSYDISVGSVAFTSGSLGNYSVNLATASGGFTVNPAFLTITANSLTKPAGVKYTFTGTEFTTTGLLSPDTVTSVTLTSTGADAGAAAGVVYKILISSPVGQGLSNYNINLVNGLLYVSVALSRPGSTLGTSAPGPTTLTLSRGATATLGASTGNPSTITIGAPVRPTHSTTSTVVSSVMKPEDQPGSPAAPLPSNSSSSSDVTLATEPANVGSTTRARDVAVPETRPAISVCVEREDADGPVLRLRNESDHAVSFGKLPNAAADTCRASLAAGKSCTLHVARRQGPAGAIVNIGTGSDAPAISTKLKNCSTEAAQ